MNAPEMEYFEQGALREVPHSNEMEQSVLGALLLNNDAIDMIGDLRAEHFFRYEHRVIFEAIQKLVISARTADVVTVYERLSTDGKIDATGGLPYLNALVQNTPGSSNVARYAEIVIDRWKLRGILLAAADVETMVHERNGREVNEIIAAAQSRLESLTESQTEGPRLAQEGLTAVIERIDAQYHGSAAVNATPTGYVDLDDKLDGGVRGGELIVVAGRPSMGKTAFAMGIANHVAENPDLNPALVFSAEMPMEQLNLRNIASIGRIPLSHLKDGSKFADEDWPKLTVAVQRISEMKLFIDESGGISLADIVSRSRALKRREGLSLIVVDYLGLVKLGDEERHDLQIGAVTRGLKELAKKLDVPIILLAQLNRELEKRPNKRPVMSDLRDSGSIEQDADVILFLYRDEVYNPDSADKGIAEVIIAKQRMGALGRVGLAFFGDNAKFSDLQSGTIFGAKPVRAKKGGFDDE